MRTSNMSLQVINNQIQHHNNNHLRNNNSNSSHPNQKKELMIKSRIIDRFERREIAAISLRMITITSALSMTWPPRRWASP